MNDAPDRGSNPFPGLRLFAEPDAPWFFGRDEAVDDALERLSRNRVLAVLGPSGSGKSSLMRAGVIPAIHRGNLNGNGGAWHVARLHPGVDPVDRELTRLAPAVGEQDLRKAA